MTNNDDHPRNHALLRRPKGWHLSPAYDLVPTPMISLERRDLALTVGNYGRTASFFNLLSQVSRFGLSIEAGRSSAPMARELRCLRCIGQGPELHRAGYSARVFLA